MRYRGGSNPHLTPVSTHLQMKPQTNEERTMKLALILIFALFAVGCAEVKARFPSSFMESPETGGMKGKMHASAALTGANEITMVNDASARPPTYITPTVSESGDANGGLGYGVFDSLD